jgi:hypothetical protein
MKQDQVSLLIQIFSRFTSSKPEFFKKIQTYILVIAALLLVLMLGNNWLDIFDLGVRGEKIVSALWYVIAFLGGGGVTAQLATNKAELQDDKTKINVVKSLDQADIHEIRTTK